MLYFLMMHMAHRRGDVERREREEQEARWVLMTEDYQEANIEEVEMNEEL